MSGPEEASPTRPVLSEQAFIACCFHDQQIFDKCRAEKRPATMFAVEIHAETWELMTQLRERGHELDPISLHQLAQEKGLTQFTLLYVSELTSAAETTAHWKQYLSDILAAWRLRQLKQASRKLGKLADEATSFEASKADVQKIVSGLSDVALDEREISLKQDMEKVISDFRDELEGNKKYSNELYTGLRLFDKNYGPIDAEAYEDYMVVVAAPPSVGKSSLARQMVYENLIRGKRACVFLLETTRKVYLKSMTGQQAKLNLRKLEEEQHLYPDKITKAAGIFQELKEKYVDQSLFVFDSHFMIEQIESQARHVASRTGGLDMIVIDYVQLVGSAKRHGSREQEVAEVSRRIKMLAKDLNCTVFAISQLSREGRKTDRPPELTDLRESGAIEQDADRVLAIHRPNTYYLTDKDGKKQEITQDPNTRQTKYHIDLYQLKMRNGPVGKSSYFFERPWTLFYDYPNVDEEGNLRKRGEY